MASTYMPAYKGYINDVPELWFKRRDGQTFHFDQLSDASVTPNVEYTEVNGGWSLYPVAYLPAASTMEMSFTSAQFSAELFAMANNGKFTANTQTEKMTLDISVAPGDFTKFQDPTSSNLKHNRYMFVEREFASLDDAPDALCLRGFDNGTGEGNTEILEGAYTTTRPEAAWYTANAGKVDAIKWSLEKLKETDEHYYLTIYLADPTVFTQTLEFYCEEELAAGTVYSIDIDNKQSAIGELIMKYPIYSNGDETSAASVKGYVIVDVYKCRATAMPGFDSSYKSGVTNGVTFSTMKPDNNVHGGAVYSIKYYNI